MRCIKNPFVKFRLFILMTFSLFLSEASFSANLTNQIEGVGPDNAIKPYICIQNGLGQVTYALAPGQSIDGNNMSGSANYVGATLRFDGCGYNNAYLGYLGFSLNNQGNNFINNYSPPQGVHIAYEEGAIDTQGHITGKIRYTQIYPNPDLSQVKNGKYWDFIGINLSGLEFGKSIDPFVIPNLSTEDVDTVNSDLRAINAFIEHGINTVRVPVRWGYLQLQGPGKGDIYTDYYNYYVRPLLQTLTRAKIHTIVDLHSYMRYSQFGKQYAGCGMDGPCPDGTLITNSKAYEDIWKKLYTLIKQDPAIDQQYILIDLVNEPVGVPDDKVFTIQANLIKMLRQQGFEGYILIEGNAWSGLHSWTTEQWQGTDGHVYTNASLFTRENFNKAGIYDLSKIVINVHQYLDSNFSGTQDNCQQDLSTVGPSGFNLMAFVDYLQQNQFKAMVTEFGTGRNSDSCAPALIAFINYLKDNSAKDKDAGFLGWTIWSAGHGWGNYNLRVTPDSYQQNLLDNYLK
ncbi:glycoside hydrolase family 5 protein [Legionella nagasakiensis]|uniref:glycoside hydrolase family 5 protein n=1 Tax=Legionella nagasakiensis TaxID=535290 RepID=UPI0010543AB0|nr:cellulase family glycosylhydrolase [Legionella nagasakiensis]